MPRKITRPNVVHVRLSDEEMKQLAMLAEKESRDSMDTIRWLIRTVFKQINHQQAA